MVMKRKLPFTFEEFKTIYYKVPRLCVDLVIKDKDKLLLTLRKKHGWEGKWHLPGGTIYFKEPIFEAVKRVSQEELGIEVNIEKHLGFIEYFSEEKERGFGYTVSLVFLCNISSGELELDDQAERAEFFQSLPDNIIDEQKIFLDKLKK